MPEEVNHEELERKLALAKSAMGANKYESQRKTRLLELDKRRLEAQSAMESATHKQNREIKSDELEKKRIEARKAMESPDQRELRENEEQTEETRNKLAERERQAEELARQKALKEKAEQVSLEARARDEKKQREETYLGHLANANSLIEEIRQKPESELSRYRTLKTDTTEAVSNENLSMTDIALKEQSRNKTGNEIINQQKNNHLLIIILITSLILGSIAILVLLFFKPNTQSANILLDQIITTENQTEIELTNTANPLATLQEKIILPNTTETINAFYFTTKTEEVKKNVPIQEVISALKLNLPTDFKYFLVDPYLVGVYHLNEKNIPFIILKTKSFEHTFASLLDNELAIAETISKLFSPQNYASSTTQGVFIDKIINNIDTRILYDSLGNSTLFYAFLNQNTLLIGQAEEIITPIINRLQTNQQNTARD